jgi:hypothetical protein
MDLARVALSERPHLGSLTHLFRRVTNFGWRSERWYPDEEIEDAL